MRVEFKLDRAGLWWSGLGVSLHMSQDRRLAGERLADWWRSSPGSRSFRLGGLAGVVSKG